MTVNEERENLERGLEEAVQSLKPAGRLVVISYHSIEDRIVKNFMRRSAASCVCPPSIPECVCNSSPTLTLVNRRVIRPTVSETQENPRARSARMRVAERI
jgi:16S rRNA (cytosine1402-N4)-methyltransferase